MKKNLPTKIYGIKQKGYIVMFVLVFASVFLTLVLGLTGFIFVQHKAQISKENRSKAFQIAEAGLHYYKWFLAHNPEDLTDGTGLPGPYVHNYSDPEGGVMGDFSLSVTGNLQCGVVTSIDIVSEGQTNGNLAQKRSLLARYARPSVAEYAYILDSNVWAGADREIRGRYHSNGGIKMDGENQSVVTSAVPDWWCTGSFGCSPSQTVNGVFGTGEGVDLWQFPVEPVDFGGIFTDLVNIKNKAISDGVYLGPSGQRGYRMVFQTDGTIDIYRVNSTSYAWGYSSAEGWQRDYHIITSETFLENRTLPVGCGLVFVEDDLWIEGEVKGKITVASADVIDPNNETDIILSNNINYTTTEGSDGLTAIAEDSVLIPLISPDNMELRGIFIAQTGQFGRHYYKTSGSKDVPSQYNSYVTRNSLEMNGTIVSDDRVGTKWSCGGSYCSGYENRENHYDRKLMIDPPPLTPYVDDEYIFVDWREQE